MSMVLARPGASGSSAGTTSRGELVRVVGAMQSRGLVTLEAVARALGVPPTVQLREELDVAAAMGLLERMHLYTRPHAGATFRLVRVTYQAIHQPLHRVASDLQVTPLLPPPPTWPGF
jgi:hypothetical protein